MALRSSSDKVGFLSIESTYGTPPTLTAADAILLMEAEITPTADKLERDVNRPYFGGDPFVLVGKKVTLTAKVDLIGAASGTGAAPLGKLYRICGHAEAAQTVVVGPPALPLSEAYTPVSKNYDSATIDFFWAGIKFRMTGCRGTLDMDYSIKQFPQATVNITGLFTIPADGEAYTTIDWTAFKTPAAIESGVWGVVIGPLTGLTPVAVCAQSLSVSQNGNINLFECSTNRQVLVTDRKPGGTLKVYKDTTLALWNPWAIADAQNIMLMDCTMTKGVGLNSLLRMRAQLEYPKPVDIDGVAGYEIPFSLVPNAGGDEYGLYFW